MLIARARGFSEEEVERIGLGAALHDIGKIAVPDAILRKNGPLTDDEWRIMRRHPELGYEILYGIAFLTDSLPVVRHHHERYDGDGYPDGLRGDAIPIGARIFSIADAFDAMTSDRHYRRALPLDQTVEELKRHSGSQFDPAVVDVLEDVAEHLLAIRRPDSDSQPEPS